MEKKDDEGDYLSENRWRRCWRICQERNTNKRKDK